MNLSVRLFLRVVRPLVFWPQGDTGCGIALAALAFATAVRVVDRVHGQTADGGADAQPAALARLADADDVVLDVAQLPDGGPALEQHLADLARGQPDLRVVALLGHQLARRCRRSESSARRGPA